MAVDTGQARLVSLRVAPERAGGGDALAVAHSLPVADPEEEAPTLTLTPTLALVLILALTLETEP